MSKVLGKNVIGYIFHGAMWKPVVCARTCEFTTTTEFIETAIKGSGKFKTFRPTMNSSGGRMDGIVTLQQTNTLGLPDLRAMQLAHTRLLLRFQRTDQDANVYTDEVYCYISQTTDAGDFKDVANFGLELIGDGAITQVFTPAPTTAGTVTRVDFTTFQDQVSVTDPNLIGKTLIEFVMDGIGYGDLILSGTPVNKEVKYDSATGTIEWAIPATDGTPAYYIFQ